MSNYYDKEEIGAVTFVLGVVLAVPIWVYAVPHASEARRQAEAQLATETGIVHWWHNNEPDKAAGQWYVGAFIATVAVFWVGYLLAPVSLGSVESINDARRRWVAKQAQKKFHESVQQLDEENRKAARQLGLAQSKQEVVTRLGTIDQFVRVFRAETEPTRQVMTLQAAHAEVTNLNAKVVSGEIDAECLKDGHVMDCVKETVADLIQSGLSNDRLSRDLRRIFKLCDTV